MKMTPIVNKAFEFAMQKHDGQKDDEGLDYFVVHIIPVANIIDNLENDEEMTVVALLHDTLEDTDTTYVELEREFGKSVADLVNELTHDGEKDSYGYYFPRLKSQKAIIIKFADRLSNLSRMNVWDEERRRQYITKSKFWKDGSDNPKLIISMSPIQLMCKQCKDSGVVCADPCKSWIEHGGEDFRLWRCPSCGSDFHLADLGHDHIKLGEKIKVVCGNCRYAEWHVVGFSLHKPKPCPSCGKVGCTTEFCDIEEQRGL